jgi:hypothetical protein
MVEIPGASRVRPGRRRLTILPILHYEHPQYEPTRHDSVTILGALGPRLAVHARSKDRAVVGHNMGGVVKDIL